MPSARGTLDAQEVADIVSTSPACEASDESDAVRRPCSRRRSALPASLSTRR